MNIDIYLVRFHSSYNVSISPPLSQVPQMFLPFYSFSSMPSFRTPYPYTLIRLILVHRLNALFWFKLHLWFFLFFFVLLWVIYFDLSSRSLILPLLWSNKPIKRILHLCVFFFILCFPFGSYLQFIYLIFSIFIGYAHLVHKIL